MPRDVGGRPSAFVSSWRTLVSGSAVGPHDANRDLMFSRVHHNIGGSAVAMRWLAVPDSPEFVRLFNHENTGSHVGFGSRLLIGQAMHAAALANKPS
jgi:hypothetical protein